MFTASANMHRKSGVNHVLRVTTQRYISRAVIPDMRKQLMWSDLQGSAQNVAAKVLSTLRASTAKTNQKAVQRRSKRSMRSTIICTCTLSVTLSHEQVLQVAHGPHVAFCYLGWSHFHLSLRSLIASAETQCHVCHPKCRCATQDADGSSGWNNLFETTCTHNQRRVESWVDSEEVKHTHRCACVCKSSLFRFSTDKDEVHCLINERFRTQKLAVSLGMSLLDNNSHGKVSPVHM
eukprot:2466386-Amphidinium_carterae.1